MYNYSCLCYFRPGCNFCIWATQLSIFCKYLLRAHNFKKRWRCALSSSLITFFWMKYLSAVGWRYELHALLQTKGDLAVVVVYGRWNVKYIFFWEHALSPAASCRGSQSWCPPRTQTWNKVYIMNVLNNYIHTLITARTHTHAKTHEFKVYIKCIYFIITVHHRNYKICWVFLASVFMAQTMQTYIFSSY